MKLLMTMRQVLIESDWNLKESEIRDSERSVRINRIRLEFKVNVITDNHVCIFCINRIRLEFKGQKKS